MFNTGAVATNVVIETFDLNGAPIGLAGVTIPAGQGLDADLVTDLGLALPLTIIKRAS